MNAREGGNAAIAQRPRLLDLFCGAGGAAMGYSWAGFEVVGVDIKDQPHYPFTFVRADALEVLAWPWFNIFESFDLVHASPPCQHYSDATGVSGDRDNHPDLIGPVREALQYLDVPYVIENVEGAPLENPTMICGTQLGLGVGDYRLRRHRLFETSWGFEADGCECYQDGRPIIDVSGGGPTHAPRLDGGGGRTYKGTVAEKRKAMGISWMTGAELVEAIPPAYTALIGNAFPSSLMIERQAA